MANPYLISYCTDFQAYSTFRNSSRKHQREFKKNEVKWLCFNFKINVLGSKIDVGNQDDNLSELTQQPHLKSN